MAELSVNEQMKFEKLFELRSGYVLDFSNSGFREFVSLSVNVDIYDTKYADKGNSKANRLRAFMEVESPVRVGKLLVDLLDQWRALYPGKLEDTEIRQLMQECDQIAENLRNRENQLFPTVLDAYAALSDFTPFVREIRKSIEDGQPEAAIDRLHAFVVKYVRQLCDKYGLSYQRGDSLNKGFRIYADFKTQSGKIESRMAAQIMRSSVSILNDFNEVRNNHSMAHDNPLLNKAESIFILNSISNLISFVEALESEGEETSSSAPAVMDTDDLPF